MSDKMEEQCNCYCMGIGPQVSDALRKEIIPDEVREHFRKSRIEFLKGIRSLIDKRIEHLSSHHAEKKGTPVSID